MSKRIKYKFVPRNMWSRIRNAKRLKYSDKLLEKNKRIINSRIGKIGNNIIKIFKSKWRPTKSHKLSVRKYKKK